MKKGLMITIVIVAVILVIFAIFHRSIIQSVHEFSVNRNQDRQNDALNNNLIPGNTGNNNYANDGSGQGVGSCTEREECENMLGKGAFCSYGKCFPAPSDYDPTIAQCYCPDGSMIKAIDCRWVDCPGETTIPTEFTIKNGIASKTTVDINLPLSGREAKKVAIAACGISEETAIPPSPYENTISECSPAWGFLDESNPCNNTLAVVCGNKTFASCVFGGESKGNNICIEGKPFIQGNYSDKFIAANPLDLSQVKKFSRYRSCLGHDYSGYNENGELETQRSMKQGGLAKSGVTKMNIYAPFDGIVIKYIMSTHDQETEEHEIEIRGEHSGKWFITFGHFTAKEGIDVNSKVKAGELIGTSTIHPTISPDGDGVELGLSQDVSTETIKEQFVRGALLDYATNEVLAEYASYGLTPENTKYTKEYRDAHPCNFAAIGSSNPDDFAVLSH